MATIDLTKPEVDLIKVRLLAQQLLDLVQPNDDDDAPPPPASDARVLAQQVLGAKTIPEAHALAQALIDAEDEPSAKRRRASKAPRTAHEDAYATLIDAVCKLLDPFCLPVLTFAAAEAHWKKGTMASTPWCARSDLPFSCVKGCVDSFFLHSGLNSHRLAVMKNQEAWPNERGRIGCVDRMLASENIAQLDLSGTTTRSFEVGVLLVPEQFAKIQRMAGDGPIGQEFFKACAAWAWALLKHQHDPQLPNAAGK